MTKTELLSKLLRASGNPKEREILEERIGRLTDRQAEMLALRLGMEDGKRYTREEVAEHMGVSLNIVRL